ncbi:MAG: tRNA (adenosine(37)-N6)-threonylcarbamoyltransferase complex transferase subunit TsaD [Sphingobacteriales bacterium]|jgi:N6-L-threonylcarbamoyladenine synthase|nr:tRNA (adenosine(37)-N6)-threonylcarbamoyltransferase complex transferase subunit TsaD [Sphingobacteriales bacterium]MCC7224762.1 tRNA (adenosine(37)-N6)-threonylcarbamoyltransferase complex transferase subunit TsaD [Chitinophagales bacterium]
MSNIIILAIESSCDDTSAAVLADGEVLSNVTANQAIHERYGGVVPELASRAHQQNIVPAVETALQRAGIEREQLSAVAFTVGPGLLGSLMVGVSFAKGLALSLGIPIIAVNHMKAHVLAHFIDEPKPSFPFLCLTVSGGHTQIVKVRDYLDMEVIGETIDDAAGEAFDKTAKLLGLPYPGGPLVDKYAQQGNPKAFVFPQPKAKGAFNFSFSGLKTSVLYLVQQKMQENPNFIAQYRNDLCASVQDTIVRYLLKKLSAAARKHQINQLAIAGGVSANSGLRAAFADLGKQKGWQTYIPQFQYCTDNAGMIAITAYYQYLAADFAPWDLAPQARFALPKALE